MFGNKKAKKNSLEDIEALQEEAEENTSDTPAEEVPAEESSVAEAAPMEETEVVPDENVENLDETEEGGDETTPQSAEPTAPLAQGSQSAEGSVDVEAIMAENKAMKEEIENLRKTLEQSAELSKEGAVAVATGDLGDIDFSAFMYGDDEAKKGATGKLVAYLMNNLKNEAAPILAERDNAKRALEVQKAIKVLSAMEDMFPGFGNDADAIEALISRDKVLSTYEDPMQSRVAGYLIYEGLKAVEKGKAGMSVDELMDLYRKNEEFRGAIEKDRLEKLKEEPELPPMPVSSSLSTHEPYTHPGPETMEEANKSLREMRRKLRK